MRTELANYLNADTAKLRDKPAVEIRSLPEANYAVFRIRELLDNILTWSDLSNCRRLKLTSAINALEVASENIKNCYL